MTTTTSTTVNVRRPCTACSTTGHQLHPNLEGGLTEAPCSTCGGNRHTKATIAHTDVEAAIRRHLTATYRNTTIIDSVTDMLVDKFTTHGTDLTRRTITNTIWMNFDGGTTAANTADTIIDDLNIMCADD